MKGDDISARLLDFAVGVIRVVNLLPKNPVGKHVAGQLVRCGTSGGSNYEEARGAESRADFIHKLGIAEKETREAGFWLRLIHHAGLLAPSVAAPLLKESEELAAILIASQRTAKRNS